VAPAGWLMFDIRTGRIEKYAGKGFPVISNEGDFRFYTYGAVHKPGEPLIGEFHWSEAKGTEL
ncbi:MAG: hypothetical protein KGJ84_14090, partial [Elusimicrobia bacterium]|nr:hypothetical protein [Elusimicrobiota bacterium]